MLVFSRKPRERVFIGDEIEVVALDTLSAPEGQTVDLPLISGIVLGSGGRTLPTSDGSRVAGRQAGFIT